MKGLHKNSLRKGDNPHQWMIDDAKMGLIQTIRAEVERLKKENANIRCEANEKYCLGYEDALNDLLSTLQEQPVKDFPTTDEEMQHFLATHKPVQVPEKYKTADWIFKEQPVCEDVEKELERFLVENVDVCVDDDTDKVRIFDVDTGKGDIDITYTDLKAIARHFAQWQKEKDAQEIIDAHRDGVLAGAKSMKEQIMKEAVEGEVINDGGEYQLIVPALRTILHKMDEGDRVRIIIVKED